MLKLKKLRKCFLARMKAGGFGHAIAANAMNTIMYTQAAIADYAPIVARDTPINGQKNWWRTHLMCRISILFWDFLLLYGMNCATIAMLGRYYLILL